ncbi:MAG TPA: MarR family transcriptional regulator [Pirellulales bacterium]|nr:MarR family transcriptional regulator [Pirellulales bacterium]
MAKPRKTKPESIDEIVGLMRHHSTAAVLLHHVVAERLGLGPTDLQCLHLLRQHGAATGSELAAITGLTTGAITGVTTRLERAGFIRRTPDPNDKRKQTLHPAHGRTQEIHRVFEPIRSRMAELLRTFDSHQLNAISQFLTASTEFAHQHMALLRSQKLAAPTTVRETPESASEA